MNSFVSGFNDIGSKLRPFSDSISKQFTQVQQVTFLLIPLNLAHDFFQLAREKMGAAGAGDVTELPAEFRELEEVPLISYLSLISSLQALRQDSCHVRILCKGVKKLLSSSQ